ncbi:MAG: FtsX-like permease family protein [Acetivibrionales bacterium]
MNKTFIKTVFREIKDSLGRFIAIFAIVALGVGFLAGLLATTPIMKTTVDRYYDDHNMADIIIKATMGLTDTDLKTILEIDEINNVMPAYVTDILTESNINEILPSRIYGLSQQFFDNEPSSAVNKLKLLEGRMPQSNSECVVEQEGGNLSRIEIGSILRISQENDDFENIGDIYNNTEFTVVGVVSNPFYFSYEKEKTSIGNGRIGAIIYVYDSNYALDAYTDFLITVKEAPGLTAFTDDYEKLNERIVEKLEAVGIDRSVRRYDEVISEAYEKIEEAKAEYEDGKKEAETKLDEAWQEIEDGREKLLDAKLEIEDGEKEIADAKNTLKENTADAHKEINDAQAELAEALIELEDGERELAEAITKLEDGKREYNEGYLEYLEGLQEISEAQREFEKGELEYEKGLEKLAKASRRIEAGEDELAEGRSKLLRAEKKYEQGMQQYIEQKAKFDSLMEQILTSLSSLGLSYDNSQELFAAMDNDDSGTVSTVVTGVLTGMRDTIQSQIDAINSLLIAINDLEAYIAALEQGAPVPPGGKTLEEAQAELASLKALYEAGEINLGLLNEALASLPPNAGALRSGWDALNKAKAELDSAESQISSGWDSYYEGRRALREGKRKYDQGVADLEKAKKELDESRQKLADGWDEIRDAKAKLEDAAIEIENGEKELSDARKELDDGWAEYYEGLEKIAEAEETLRNEIADAEQKIRDAEEDLAKGRRDYEEGLLELADGEADYQEAKTDAVKELADAAKKIADAEKDIAEIELPEWYVLDRKSNVSYVSFSMNADKVAAISTVFPVFFYLVAALVTLTTMTRMVEKERTQIGTLKSLGYKKSTIMSKYLFYCGLASISGSIAGLLIGFNILPNVIWKAYGMLYRLPPLQPIFMWDYAIPASVIAVMCTMAATVNACSHTLKEKPARLMVPKAPKAGKRIFLERVTFIWSRLKFAYKATARNLLRYKKHFFMTVIGIAGCTALMVAGFGIKDSIKDVADTQFENIFKYRLLIELDPDKQYDEILAGFLNDPAKVTDHIGIFRSEGTVIHGNENFQLSIITPETGPDFIKFINLNNRKTGESIELNDDSVILTEKLADSLNLSIGEKFILENDDGRTAELVVTDLCENYVGGYIYLTKASYARYFYAEPKTNAILVNSRIEKDSQKDDVITEVLLSEAVSGAEFTSQTQRPYKNLLSSMGFIVVVLVIAAGALAVIVLYNLINININERNNELATLKVLGYHNNEVAGYVFRETIILSIAGTLAGLFLGAILHRFIVAATENHDLMIGRNITPLSFVLSAGATLLFSLAVDIIMYGKLKNIEMVDSMKAVD